MKARVEGFIVCLSQETSDYSHFEQIIEGEIPLVFFDRVCLQDRVPTVVADSFEAARGITRHFCENMAQRIVYISGPDYLNISEERRLGYLQGLLDYGREFHATVVYPMLTSVVHPTKEMGKVAAQRFFELTGNMNTPPKSVILKTKLIIRESSIKH